MLSQKDIRRELPRLRRFGLMLLASRTLADHLTTRCLQELLDDPTLRERGDNAAVVLFRRFHQICPNNVAVVEDEAVDDPVAEALPKATFKERKVFLLLYVEQFDISDAAQIMDLDVAELRTMEDCLSSRIDFR